MSDPQRNTPPGGSVKSVAQIGERVKQEFAKHNYELLGELGRGGMGVVYLAQHKKLGRRVAIKTLTPDRATKESSIRRFEREARSFASIRHPHIANLYEFQDSGPIQFLALEYIEGTDLERERRKGRRWNAKDTAKLMRCVADALDHSHQKGILHRDIKPGNILIERNTERVVLTDFGLAKGKMDDTLTATGFAVGTPAYMAPEQITDQFGTEPDGRADLFSLGTVAYEMLTQEHPFLANDDLSTMRNIVNGKIKGLRELDASIPRELAAIIERCIQRNPKERFADAATLVKELDNWLLRDSQSGSGVPGITTPATPPGGGIGAPTQNSGSGFTPTSPTPADGISKKTVIVLIVVFCVVALAIGLGIGLVLSGGE